MRVKPLVIETTKVTTISATGTLQWVKENKLPDDCVGLILEVGSGETIADLTALRIKARGGGTVVEFPALTYLLAYANRAQGDIRYATTSRQMVVMFHPNSDLLEGAFSVKDIESLEIDYGSNGSTRTWRLTFLVPATPTKYRVEIVSIGQNLASGNNQGVSKGMLRGQTKSIIVTNANFNRLRIKRGGEQYELTTRGIIAMAESDYYENAAGGTVSGWDQDRNNDLDGLLDGQWDLIGDMGGADTNPVAFEQVFVS